MRRTRRSGGRRRRAGSPRGRPPAVPAARRSARRTATSPTARPAPPWRTPARRSQSARNRARRRPRTPCASGRSRPESPASAATDRTAARPRVGRRSAGRCAGPKERAHLPHVVIDDRPAALEPQPDQDLPDPLTLDPRVIAQQPVDLVLERIELRRPRRPLIDRRRRGAQRPTDRLPMQPRSPADLPDRQPLDEPHPTDLRPLLHADHPSSPRSVDKDRARVRTQPDSTHALPGGVSFQPAWVVQIQPAPTPRRRGLPPQ
jgi:hypothetical protein